MGHRKQRNDFVQLGLNLSMHWYHAIGLVVFLPSGYLYLLQWRPVLRHLSSTVGFSAHSRLSNLVAFSFRFRVLITSISERSLPTSGVEFDDPARGKHDGAVEKSDVSSTALARHNYNPVLRTYQAHNTQPFPTLCQGSLIQRLTRTRGCVSFSTRVQFLYAFGKRADGALLARLFYQQYIMCLTEIERLLHSACLADTLGALRSDLFKRPKAKAFMQQFTTKRGGTPDVLLFSMGLEPVRAFC